jgi:hypothetical protein
MPAAQHTFDPAEKQFHGPPIAIRDSNQLRVQVQPIRDQDHNVERAIVPRLARRDLHQAERLRQQAGMVCRPQAAEDRIADDTRVHCGGREGTLLLHLIGGVVLHPTEKAARQVVQFLKQAIVDIAPINHIEAAWLYQAPPLGPLRPVASCDCDIDRPPAQDRKGHMHLGGPMLLVLPQGPGHARQGGQEAAIDRNELGQGGLLGQRQVRAQAGSQRGQDFVQQGRVEDVGCFTEGTQGRRAEPEALLHVGQGRRLLQAAQAGHHRIKKVQQQQAGILIIEQLPVPGAVPLRCGTVEVRQERAQQAKIFESLEGLL